MHGTTILPLVRTSSALCKLCRCTYCIVRSSAATFVRVNLPSKARF